MAFGENRERGDTHRAFPTEGEHPVDVSGGQRLQTAQCTAQGRRDLGTGLDPVDGTTLRVRDVDGDGRAVMLREQCVQDAGADGVAPAGVLQRELRQQGGDVVAARTLPLRPDQAEGTDGG